MSHILTITEDQARDKLLKRPFKVTHSLADHPLFRLERIVRLAQSMDRDRIEYNAGNAAISQKPEETPRINMAPTEIISSIENCNAWLVIKTVELDPDYRAVLHAVIADIQAATGYSEKDITDIRGFLFVSSAHSTTPFHIDGEDNFLLHIHGEKEVHVFENEDRALVGEEAMEMSPDKHRNQPYRPEFEERAEVFRLKPLSLAALGEHGRCLLDLHCRHLEERACPAPQQDPLHERHTEALRLPTAGTGPPSGARFRQGAGL
jgi:hypothetical protein